MGTATDSRDEVPKCDAAHDQTLVAVRVVCELKDEHPLSGLFVLWAPLVATLLHDLFECGQKSLPACHIFRSVSMVGPTGNGWLNNSIHKTGLAIDLAMDFTPDIGFQKPMPGWTIRIEHRKRDQTSFPRVEAQKQLDDAWRRLVAAQQAHTQDSLRLGRIPCFFWPPPVAEPGLTPEAARARADRAELAAAAGDARVHPPNGA